MNNLLKFGIAYYLAPTLVGVVVVLLATAIGLTFTAVVIATAIAATLTVAIIFGRPLISAFCRWFRNHFSPVRRRQPRPAAWHQWR